MPSIATLFQNQEESEGPENALVSGSIPNWLNGSYLRVGPGKFDIGEISMRHFIDGYAMLSKFDIREGSVTFNKKYVQSTAYKKAAEQKQPYFPEFATKGNIASTKNIFTRLANTFSSNDITDNCSINVYQIGDEVYAASETCHVHSIDTKKLESSDKIDYYKVFGVHMATAHPIEDKKGDWYNIGTSFTTGCKYQVLKIPAIQNGSVKDAITKASVVASIYPSWSTCFSYYHTFAMTENYIIMVEQPLIMSVMKMTDAKLKGKSIREIMEWTEGEKNRFHVVDKRTGEVFKTKYYSEPFFFFHFVNSYEEEDHLIIDVDAYPSHKVMDKMSIERLRAGDLDQKDPSRIQRFVLPIIRNVKDVAKSSNLVTLQYTAATAKREADDTIMLASQGIGEAGFEGPKINPLKRFEKHRFVYGTGSLLPGYYANSLCKIDVTSGVTNLWKANEFVFPGEPIFIPNPESTEEDAGVLMAACSNVRSGGKDFVVFVSAKTMTELGRATVTSQIPQSLHGIFLPEVKPKNGVKIN